MHNPVPAIAHTQGNCIYFRTPAAAKYLAKVAQTLDSNPSRGSQRMICHREYPAMEREASPAYSR